MPLIEQITNTDTDFASSPKYLNHPDHDTTRSEPNSDTPEFGNQTKFAQALLRTDTRSLSPKIEVTHTLDQISLSPEKNSTSPDYNFGRITLHPEEIDIHEKISQNNLILYNALLALIHEPRLSTGRPISEETNDIIQTIETNLQLLANLKDKSYDNFNSFSIDKMTDLPTLDTGLKAYTQDIINELKATRTPDLNTSLHDLLKRTHMITLDLKNFKWSNDVLGKEGTDHLVFVFAQKIRTYLEDSYQQGLIDSYLPIRKYGGGDEFMILVTENTNHPQHAATLNHNLHQLARTIPITRRNLDNSKLTPHELDLRHKMYHSLSRTLTEINIRPEAHDDDDYEAKKNAIIASQTIREFLKTFAIYLQHLDHQQPGNIYHEFLNPQVEVTMELRSNADPLHGLTTNLLPLIEKYEHLDPQIQDSSTGIEQCLTAFSNERLDYLDNSRFKTADFVNDFVQAYSLKNITNLLNCAAYNYSRNSIKSLPNHVCRNIGWRLLTQMEEIWDKNRSQSPELQDPDLLAFENYFLHIAATIRTVKPELMDDRQNRSSSNQGNKVLHDKQHWYGASTNPENDPFYEGYLENAYKRHQ